MTIEIRGKRKMSYCATIGFFDGVHRGHQYLVSQLMRQAAQRGEQTMVLTFDVHPRQALQPGWKPQLLSSLSEKCQQLLALGVNHVEVLPFTAETAQLSARSFMQYMHSELQVDTLLTGYDNRFGHNRTESFDDYVQYGHELGMQVVCAEPLRVGDCEVSSSRIRQLLTNGDVVEGARCLGRPYTLGGTVVHGEQIGRRMGFPTANLQPAEPLKIIPKDGVYVVYVHLDRADSLLQGITNIGTRPTFDGTSRTVETFVFDFDGDLYRHNLSLSFIARLRDEKHFSSAEALAQQMHADVQRAQKLLQGL